MATFKVEHFGTPPKNDQGYIADRDLYLDAEGNIVEKGDPKTASKLIGKGGALSTEVAEKYGLLKKGKAAKAAAPETEEAATEATGGEQDSEPPAAKPAKKTAAKKKSGAKK